MPVTTIFMPAMAQWQHGGQRGAALTLLVLLTGVALAATAVAAETLVEDRSPVAFGLCMGWLVLGLLAAWAAPHAERRAITALALVAASFAWRFLSIHFVTGVDLGADPMNYQNLAHAVLDGRGLITDDWRYGRDLRAYFPPLYPLLLAGWWRIFGEAPATTLAMTTLIDAASAWMIADTGRRLGQKTAGWLAAMLFFSYPPFALSAAIPQKEALTILLVTAMVRSTAIWLGDADGWARLRHGIMLGGAWGLLALTQPGVALLPAAVALGLATLRGWRATLWLGIMAVPALVLVMLPWWVRNWLVFGTFVPFTTASGFMTNVALGAHGVPIPGSIFALPEPQRSTIIGGEAVRRIGERPLSFILETGRALLAGFAYEEATLARYRHTTPPISTAARAMLTGPLQLAYVSVIAAAALRCWQQLRIGRISPLVPIGLAMILGIGAINMWFEFGERHRYALAPILFLLAAGALLEARRRTPPAA